MGHQLAGAVAAAALVLSAGAVLVGCGGDADDTQPPPVLENARAVVSTVDASSTSESGESIGSSEPGGSSDASEPGAGATSSVAGDDQPSAADVVVDELPAPDPALFEGANRVVNLWVGLDGATTALDVWARRSFTSGPVLLVEDLAFGAASDYFASPPGHTIEVVASGAGPDGAALAGVFHAGEGEQITTVVTNDDERGAIWAPNIWESDPLGGSQAPEPPARDLGLVLLVAPNTRSFADSLTATVGSDAFFVGDGSTECAPQRIEEEGFQPAVLGGTQQVELEVEPGPASITLHPWPSPEMCDTSPVLEIDVDVPVAGIVLVLVYSADGVSLDSLVLPVG